MCDVCRDLIDLMVRYDREINEIVLADDEVPDIKQPLAKHDVEILMAFIQAWHHKRCNCIFRDINNIERLNYVIRGLLVTAASQLKSILKELSDFKSNELSDNQPIEGTSKSSDRPIVKSVKPPHVIRRNIVVNRPKPKEDDNSDSNSSHDDIDTNDEDADDEEEDEDDEGLEDDYPSDFVQEKWTQEEREKLFMLTSKVFMYQFPVYSVQKHNVQSMGLDELSRKEATLLAQFCDLNDSDISLLLLRNIAFFCNQEVLDLTASIFIRSTPDSLSLTLAHTLVAVIHQLKTGLNLTNVCQKLVSLRTNVINYLCKVSEKDLRVPLLRNLFEFMWSAVKDPMEMNKNGTIDEEGLTLALKYFTTTTLTMRLTGINQINNYISMFSEYSQSDHPLSQRHIQDLQEQLTQWILNNKIVEHVFGPNLHVEVIKQSHVVLNFIVSRLTCKHVEDIWAAAQLKHCSKQVHDLLTQLVKNMELNSVVHLYTLLRGLEAKDHNEQTLHLASCILKYIWSRSLNIEQTISPALNMISGMVPGVSNPVRLLILPRPDDGDSSSAEPSDVDEEDDYDDVIPTGKPLVIPEPSPGSSSCWTTGSSQEGVVQNDEEVLMDSDTETVTEVIDSCAVKRTTSIAGNVDCSPIKKPKRGDGHSSRNSETSQKRMSDFEGEDSHDGDAMEQEETEDEEFPTDYQEVTNIPIKLHVGKPIAKITASPEPNGNDVDPLRKQFSIDNVCLPGNTIVWDLLQDDKISQLPEGLAQEAEKVLYSLICWVNDRRLRIKFIEGCLDNLEKNTSVNVSLRLLPKLFVSFQGFRNAGCIDIHNITLWANEKRHMLKHFFNALVLYCDSRSGRDSPGSSSSPDNMSCKSRQGKLSHSEEIQIRLQFLQFILGSAGSPEHLKLTRDQLDTLWSCLAHDNQCRDDLFHWILNQIRGREQHALSPDHFRQILKEKLPEVKPENYSMLALEIVHHLCLYFLNTPNAENMVSIAIKLLWDIALTATNIKVSLPAIQYLNSYYIHSQADEEGPLTKEKEFIEQCMKFLRDSSSLLKTDEDKHSTIIQRAITLLNTHLDAFRSRYAFHLRKKLLEGDSPIVSHRTKVGERAPQSTLRLVVSTASLSERTTLEMQDTDSLAELRAEVIHWYEKLSKKPDGAGNEGTLRLLAGGQELYHERDEKTLGDLQLKDGQTIYVHTGSKMTTRRGRDSCEPSSNLPFPPKNRIPMILLLEKSYFEQLFDLIHQLSSMTGPSHSRSQYLSRQVWKIIEMLPTSPDLLGKLESLTSDNKEEENDENRPSQSIQEGMSLLLNELLTPTHPQKLLYSLEIVDYLRRTYVRKEKSWAEEFVDCNGLQHVLDIFISGVLLQNDSENCYNEWKQDCQVQLLQLIYKFGTAISSNDRISDVASTSKDSENLHLSSLTRNRKRTRKGNDKPLTHTFNDRVLGILNNSKNMLLRVLMSVLQEVSSRASDRSNQTGFFHRYQVVGHVIGFLSSYAFSEPSVGHEFLKMPNFSIILKNLLLDDPDKDVRKVTCTGFSKLCISSTSCTPKKGLVFIPSVLNSLLSFIAVAQNMRPSDKETSLEYSYSEKEGFGCGCRDYFSLVVRLLDSLDKSDKDTVDFDRLCSLVSSGIINREVRESRVLRNEDEGLRGLLLLMEAAVKHDPPFKHSQEAKNLLSHIYDSLFALPSIQDKNAPKCKHPSTREAAFDLLIELTKNNDENFVTLVNLLQEQHISSPHSSYPWDFWPQDDCRSECGYVGLVNLGATCYMASCLQHLFMIPEVRKTVLSSNPMTGLKHEQILYELQRMFAFLQESERKSYNPRSFCKVYTMDHELLNTGEQKDMTEFFTDLISKFEEMSPSLKGMVKKLFGGTLSNNVVSLECPHISRTTEEFYSLRCKVADMKNIFDSLDDLTVKDTLEGDNMYTCSQCGKKVRAEKRACIKKLPRILCFNTMRYTFNMLTMTKEKVNTHFSFPMILNMSPYLEDNLIPRDDVKASVSDDGSSEAVNQEDYELIGVTVHTGTAEGGHYYSFIREREESKGRDKWYMFNDADVKQFDPNLLGSECFGGEMTSKTYDSQTDKFMDFSFEKTNSAYMLFYERIDKTSDSVRAALQSGNTNDSVAVLPPELSSWIWEDNTQFTRDRTIFEHKYFQFISQVCDVKDLPTPRPPEVQILATKLAASFLLQTYIHSKMKPTLSDWIELLNKQFVSNPAAGVWFLEHLTEDHHWLQQILQKCPNPPIRQLLIRLCVHVVNNLRMSEKEKYLQPLPDCEREGSRGTEIDKLKLVGSFSCVTRFVKKLLTLIKFSPVNKPHPKYLTEYFNFFLEFAKMGEEECRFLLVVEAINTFVQFYLNYCKAGNDVVEMNTDDEEDDEEDVTPISFRSGHVTHLGIDDKVLRPVSLEKMITLIAYLVEKSRGSDQRLHLSSNDQDALFSGKMFPFIQRQIRDSVNIKQTINLINSFCRHNDSAPSMIVQMLFNSIRKTPESSSPFFRVFSLLVESNFDPTEGFPNFSQLIFPHVWDFADTTPQQSLDWLAQQVLRNRTANAMVLSTLKKWVAFFLIEHNVARVRNCAVNLLISLVPNSAFRQSYNKPSARLLLMNPRENMELTPDAVMVIQKIYGVLLGLLSTARDHADASPSKLVSYFTVMTHCLIGKQEKLMLVPYFNDLWNLFQPKLSEPPIATNQNKQALLNFWFQACQDCPENIQCIVNSPQAVKNIAFNYILADHEDHEIIAYNRLMLPCYYGILRMCCQHSRAFTRQLAGHQNITWAFKNITPHMNHYAQASQELFKLMELFIQVNEETTETEKRQINEFKKSILHMYLTQLDSRNNWCAIVRGIQTLMRDPEDIAFVILNNGMFCLLSAFHTLFVMFHEATACHVSNDIVDVLKIVGTLLDFMTSTPLHEVKEWTHKWKEQSEQIKKLVYMLNSYTTQEVRVMCMIILEKFVILYPKESVPVLVQFLGLGHLTFQDTNLSFSAGPYFPRKGMKILQTKSSLRPSKPTFQMHFHPRMLEAKLGVDPDYDAAVIGYFTPYYNLIVNICKTAIKNNLVSQELVGLCSMVALESLPMRQPLFVNFFKELLECNASEDECYKAEKDFLTSLCDKSCANFNAYITQILTHERSFVLNDETFSFLKEMSPKIKESFILNQVSSITTGLISEIIRQDPTAHDLEDFQSLLKILRCLNLTLLYEETPTGNTEFMNFLKELRKQMKLLLDSEEKSTLEESPELEETPRKKVKLDEETEKTDESKETTTQNESNVSTRDASRSTSTSTSSSSSESSVVEENVYSRIAACVSDIIALLDKKNEPLSSTSSSLECPGDAS